jgi:hypothetical protein
MLSLFVLLCFIIERKENTKQRKEKGKRQAVFYLREKEPISTHFREVFITVGALKKSARSPEWGRAHLRRFYCNKIQEEFSAPEKIDI